MGGKEEIIELISSIVCIKARVHKLRQNFWLWGAEEFWFWVAQRFQRCDPGFLLSRGL